MDAASVPKSAPIAPGPSLRCRSASAPARPTFPLPPHRLALIMRKGMAEGLGGGWLIRDRAEPRMLSAGRHCGEARRGVAACPVGCLAATGCWRPGPAGPGVPPLMPLGATPSHPSAVALSFVFSRPREVDSTPSSLALHARSHLAQQALRPAPPRRPAWRRVLEDLLVGRGWAGHSAFRREARPGQGAVSSVHAVVLTRLGLWL